MRLGHCQVYLLHPPIPHKSFYATSELIDINFYADFHLDVARCAGGQLQRANPQQFIGQVIK